MSRSGSVAMEQLLASRVNGAQRPPLAFVLDENILSTSCDKNDVV